MRETRILWLVGTAVIGGLLLTLLMQPELPDITAERFGEQLDAERCDEPGEAGRRP